MKKLPMLVVNAFIWIALLPCLPIDSKASNDIDAPLDVYNASAQNITSDTILPPWDQVDLTDVRMKSGYPFVVKDGSFPWLPVVGGIVAVGTGTYFLTKENDEDPEPCSFTISAPTVSSTCGMANGSATILTNPPGDYTYVWSNGATSASISEVNAGSFIVTVSRTGTSCTQAVTMTIPNTNPPFDASISTQDAACGQHNGSAIVTVTPAGPYTYQWSNGSSAQNQMDLAVGTYSLTISAGGECFNSYSVYIVQAPFVPTVNITTTSSGCGVTDGTATATVDPPGEYTYAWSNGQSGPEATGLGAGSYTVTVSVTGTNCTHTETFNVDELPAGHTVSVTTTSSGCGLSDGTATATVDPPGEYTYAWSNGQIGPQATGLGAGAYTVSVGVVGSTCTQVTTFNVDELPAGHTVSVTTTSTGCGLSDGTATATVDPPGEYTYTWSNGQSGPEATGFGAGAYTVSVSVIGSTCTQVTTFTVDELPAGHAVSVTTTSSGCGLSDGTATAIVDPPGEYMYTWSNGQSGPEATGLGAGQYSVSVSVPGSACFVVQEFNIDQLTGNFTGTITTNDSSCGLADGTATVTIDPPGEYTYAWSNGQSTPMADMLAPGSYTLVVTDTNQCPVEFSFTIGQDSAEYITIVSTTPGTCLGGGQITITLSTPGNGPLLLQIDGPEGTTTQTLAPGTYQLSAFFPVTSGTYTMTVYDQSIGTECLEEVTASVADNTPDLSANDDFYETPGGVSLNGNALDNDSGLDIDMTSVSDIFGGSVTFFPTGEFDFIPDPGFSGDASFVYTITDACGTTSTATVTIIVAETICEFSTEFTSIPASCGLDDGAITAEVFEPGSYDYLWSNGDSGPSISALFAGTYTVTITDLNLGCDLEFTVDLPENPAEHIDDVLLTQPACGVNGEVQFTVSSNSQNPLVMSVDHPNGSDVFFIDPGVILLSDYVSITAGNYTIVIFDAGAGEGCSESLEVTLVATPSIEIIAEAVIPPSEPTAMDGLVIIVAVVPGILPYEIFLNGSSWGVAIDHTFPVTGLGSGAYTIQLVDAAGCTSNLLEIFVPVPPITLSFGTSILQTSVYDAHHEPVAPDKSSILWRSVLTSSLGYYIGRVRQEVISRYGAPVGDLPGFVEVQYLADIGRVNIKGVSLAMQGGLGSHFEKQRDVLAGTLGHSNYYLVRASGGYTIARAFKLQAGLEMRGWDKLELPRVEVGLSVPFARTSFRWVK